MPHRTPTHVRPSRRSVLLGAALVTFTPTLVGCGRTTGRSAAAPERPWSPTTPLAVPPVLEPTGGQIDLTLQVGQHEFLPGHPTETWGINGPVLGPTVRLPRGTEVGARVANDLPETSTLHWHGLDVPAASDGGPHQAIEPGSTWTPRLPVEQPAATLWYHPHPHGSTADHVHRGLAGLLYVDDPHAPEVLPSRYGVDDIPLVLQDRSISEDGESERASEPNFGWMGTDICVNGTLQPWLRVRTERVRLRLLNGSNARLYNLALADSRSFQVIANDVGLLPAPVRAAQVSIGPGERIEIVVELIPGETVLLETRDGKERIERGTLPIIELRADDELEPSPDLPARLGGPEPLVPAAGATERHFELQGHDEINGRQMDMTRIDEVVPAGALEIWHLTNTVYAHNFHIHAARFTVLEVNGQAPPAWMAGHKDTVHLPARSSARLAVQLTHHTDPKLPYMYHCHILRHEDAGMMGQFVVVEPGTEDSTPRTIEATGSHSH